MAPLQDLYDNTRYHVLQGATLRSQWSVNESVYMFEQPIGSPFVGFRTPYVGYEAVDVILYHNDTPIHTQSLRQAFYDHGGPYMNSVEPLFPHIQAELPPLKEGDQLRLEICALCYGGQTLTSVLEEMRVVAESAE